MFLLDTLADAWSGHVFFFKPPSAELHCICVVWWWCWGAVSFSLLNKGILVAKALGYVLYVFRLLVIGWAS